MTLLLLNFSIVPPRTPAYCAPASPPPRLHGDSVNAGPPLGVAARIGSTPDSNVTHVTVLLVESGCDATIITASPVFRSETVWFGSLLTSCDRSAPADRP